MTDQDELKEIRVQLNRLETRFEKLAEDYTNLRHEVNELEEKLERRT